MTAALVIAVLAVAFANGANDNVKGVATILGSRTARYRTAMAWATITTLAGAVVSIWFAEALFKVFGGADLVPAGVAATPVFLFSAACGAAGAVLIATVLGLPISTTHGLMGALLGAGLVLAPQDLRWSVLGSKFALPLALSPVAAMLATLVLYPLFRGARKSLGVTAESCVCIGQKVVATCPTPAAAVAYMEQHVVPTLETGTTACCTQRYNGAVAGVSAQQALDSAHFLTAGAMSFARGLNDAPKIAALAVAASIMGVRGSVALVAAAMAVGGIALAKKVARTMSERVAEMNTGQGFTASLVTSALVISATAFGLPVSTTHVSCGALFGIGTVNGSAKWKMICTILLAWVTTLPVAALIAMAGAAILK
ncbi:MAG: inorganic phosphate transporter PiT [Planctomycetota bacterium]|nr:MAG: inorganic phosphate transporter PiT [Planctomycetota bacterium]